MKDEIKHKDLELHEEELHEEEIHEEEIHEEIHEKPKFAKIKGQWRKVN